MAEQVQKPVRGAETPKPRPESGEKDTGAEPVVEAVQTAAIGDPPPEPGAVKTNAKRQRQADEDDDADRPVAAKTATDTPSEADDEDDKGSDWGEAARMSSTV